MKFKALVFVVSIIMVSFLSGCRSPEITARDNDKWLAHDMNRPRPPVVTPGQNPSDPPSNAIVLFDGTDFSQWVSAREGTGAKWIVKDGYMQANRTGDIRTKKSFGSCQLHIEWASPEIVEGNSQGRGNSGVYFMSRYEVQVLDSYKNDTYPDGQTAAIYGRKPPLVNASRPPGQWQSYDIIFHRPVFKDGKVVKDATFTILHNGVLVQDHFESPGGTSWINEHKVADYKPHRDKDPLLLQDHGCPVRYRNIWIVELSN